MGSTQSEAGAGGGGVGRREGVAAPGCRPAGPGEAQDPTPAHRLAAQQLRWRGLIGWFGRLAYLPRTRQFCGVKFAIFVEFSFEI